MSIFLYLYFSLIGLAFYYNSDVALYSLIIFGVVFLISINLIKKSKIKNLKKAVEMLLSDSSYEFTSYVKINKADWEFFNELPGFSSVHAKKAVWLRKHAGKYKSVEDFFEKNNVVEENQEILRKIIKL